MKKLCISSFISYYDDCRNSLPDVEAVRKSDDSDKKTTSDAKK